MAQPDQWEDAREHLESGILTAMAVMNYGQLLAMAGVAVKLMEDPPGEPVRPEFPFELESGLN